VFVVLVNLDFAKGMSHLMSTVSMNIECHGLRWPSTFFLRIRAPVSDF
jgi:hypothetical protein